MTTIEVEVTYPSTLEGMRVLQDRIDTSHANMVMNIVNKINCSYESKTTLLKNIKEKVAKVQVESTLDRFLKDTAT